MSVNKRFIQHPFSLWVVMGFVAMISLANRCEDPCEGLSNEIIGEESFTITYEDPNGTNYLESIYREDKVVVYVDKSGGEDDIPEYERIFPGYENGTFGPFNFTEEFFDPTTNSPILVDVLNQVKRYDYFIRKDTIGVDTLTVEFLLATGPCVYDWEYIRYYRNGVEINGIADVERAEFIFVE
ncbi:MAG: hypothetical protein AAFQ83_03855 [Bacteroidota bacterium]